MCEINKVNGNKIVTVGFTKETVTSIEGITVIPDITIDEVSSHDALIFILPGGSMWETFDNTSYFDFLKKFHTAYVRIAAICAASCVVA